MNTNLLKEEWRLLYRTGNKTNKTLVKPYKAVSCLRRLGRTKRDIMDDFPAGSQNALGRAYYAQYLTCLPSLADVMFWVKFSPKGRGFTSTG
ncbi:MAG: hypothetical protein LBD29_06865 [Treponema sp.]|jgi:hypothetical protein|nr:hypothetical protein [Treponema sp.]